MKRLLNDEFNMAAIKKFFHEESYTPQTL